MLRHTCERADRKCCRRQNDLCSYLWYGFSKIWLKNLNQLLFFGWELFYFFKSSVLCVCVHPVNIHTKEQFDSSRCGISFTSLPHRISDILLVCSVLFRILNWSGRSNVCYLDIRVSPWVAFDRLSDSQSHGFYGVSSLSLKWFMWSAQMLLRSWFFIQLLNLSCCFNYGYEKSHIPPLLPHSSAHIKALR